MQGKQFGCVLSGASALGSLLGMFLTSGCMERALKTPVGRALWVGIFFLIQFVLGFAALQIAIAMNRKYKFEQLPLKWVAFLTAGVLVFGIGFGGQYLFMYSKEEISVPAEVDMVLLLDTSSSMEAAGFDRPRTDAACQFVDSLNENTRLQAVSFAGKVLDSTQFLAMSNTNKDTLKQMISAAIDGLGMTDFNEPLQQAMETLNSQGRENCNKAVILLTDGQSGLDNHVMNDYIASDIRVFTIRISESTSLSSNEQDLIDFTAATGGFDTQLMPDYSGNVDTADMLNAFRNAFEATSQRSVNMREDLLVYAADGITMNQFLIRTLVMILCVNVIGFGYFGRLTIPSVVSSSVMGMAAAVLVFLTEGTAYWLCALVVVLLIETAYVFVDLRGEDRFYV